VGNVMVTYADGTIDFWTLKGNCKLPNVSSQGAVGWVVCETQLNSNLLKLYDGVAIGSRLAVNFRGRMVANLRAAKPFIEDWTFETDGRHVVVKSRFAHGSAIIERFALRDGPAEAAVEAYAESLPSWKHRRRDRLLHYSGIRLAPGLASLYFNRAFAYQFKSDFNAVIADATGRSNSRSTRRMSL